MNIFVDMHHNQLYASLQRLFENRLGHQLFRPIGKSWFTSGNWLLAKPYSDHPSTIEQYLGFRDATEFPWNQIPKINEVKEKKTEYYIIKSQFKDQNAVTFEQFKEMRLDIIIASYLPHFSLYKELVRKYHPEAKLILQIGNEWAVDFNEVKNLLASTYPFQVPEGINAVFYHQEIAPEYTYRPFEGGKVIMSFVHTLSYQSLFKKDWEDFLELERLLPEYKFQTHGSACRDGVVNSDIMISQLMKGTTYGLHLKTGGDGFGHTIFNWAASGRPLIYRSSQYKNKLASELMVNMATGFDIDLLGLPKVAELIRNISPESHQKMCESVRYHYEQAVNYDDEQKQIEKFMKRLN